MKRNFISLIIIAIIGASQFAQGQESAVRPRTADVFMIGLCVGQTLATQHVVVSLPPKSKPDPQTDAAFKTAVHSCQSKFNLSSSPTS